MIAVLSTINISDGANAYATTPNCYATYNTVGNSIATVAPGYYDFVFVY